MLPGLYVFAFVASLMMLSPVHAETVEAGAGQDASPGPAEQARSPIEERIRTYRERFDQREMQRRLQRVQRDEESRKRREAMQKYFNKQMDARLTSLEKRQEAIARRHEAMRNSAQDRYNFLTRNSEDRLNKMLDEQLDIANRHEELRKQAEERHRRMAAHRDAMLDMTPQERRAYMEEHASDIFGRSESDRRPPVPPRPPGMMRRQPPVPPYMDADQGAMAK